MIFSDFVCMEAIQLQLTALDKEGVIRELTGAVVSAGEIDKQEHENIVQRILERERLGTTGIGGGVAVPHAKHIGVTHTIGTIGVSQQRVLHREIASADHGHSCWQQRLRLRPRLKNWLNNRCSPWRKFFTRLTFLM